jgi:hypothetical protein
MGRARNAASRSLPIETEHVRPQLGGVLVPVAVHLPTIGVLRVPSGVEPATEDDPALFLSAGAPPVALAPWSKLEAASSADCARDRSGYRAVLQTGLPWDSFASTKRS